MTRFYPALLFTYMTLVANVAHASDACQTFLCMVGKLQGQSGGKDCDEPVSDYFSIVQFGKHGRFDPGKTANARAGFINSCPASGTGDWPMQINAAYGTVRILGR